MIILRTFEHGANIDDPSEIYFVDKAQIDCKKSIAKIVNPLYDKETLTFYFSGHEQTIHKGIVTIDLHNVSR